MLVTVKKKLLKSKNFLILESLTTPRAAAMKMLEELKSAGKVSSFCFTDGRLFYIRPNKPGEKLILDPFVLNKLPSLD